MEAELAAAAARLRAVEDRLERLLAAGWRNAAAEAVELTEEAEALAALGLGELAGRLRAVAAAGDAPAALGAIALGVSACRLLRAYLPAQVAPPGAWAPLSAPGRRSAAASERLLPVARLDTGAGEMWACVRRRGLAAADWLLIAPPALEWPERESALARGARGFVARLVRGAPPAETDRRRAPWLWQELQGRLRWQARLPLGTNGEIEASSMSEAEWAGAGADEALRPFREALADGTLTDDLPVLSGGGRLRMKELAAVEATNYVWADASAEEAFRAASGGRETAWALAWCAGALVTPLALIEPGAHGRPGRLVHLVPGTPADEIG